MTDVTSALEKYIYYKENRWAFITQCVYTRDEIDDKNPIKTLPNKEYLRLYTKIWELCPLLAIPKTRRMTFSWTTIGLYVHDFIFKPVRNFAFVSKKEDDANELILRAKFILDHIPEDKISRQLIPAYHYTFNNLKCPEMDSKIQGFPQGADQLRQFTFSGVFGDESAFWDDAEEFYSATFPTIDGGGRMTLVSSVAPGFFKRLCFDALDVKGDINVAEYAPDYRKPMQGVRMWINPKNKFVVLEIHYTADPTKRDPSYRESIKSSMPLQQYLREYELHWDTYSGHAVYPEFSDIHIINEEPKISVGLPMLISFDFGLCYDDKTEVLTENGWKLFKDVQSEKVATLNPQTFELEYEIPKFKVDMPYKGKMIDYDGDAMNFTMTPDHVCPVWYDKNDLRRHSGADVMKHPRHKYFRLTANYEANDGINELGLKPRDYAAFMGAYLSEGSSGNCKTTIYQKKEQKWLLPILEKTGLKFSQHSYGFDLHGKELSLKMKAYGISYDKRIPKVILNGSKDSMMAFIDSYTLGDGHIRVRKNGAVEHTIFSVSKGMVDDLSELALKLGWHSSIRYVKPTKSLMKSENRIISSNGGYSITFKKSSDWTEPVRDNFTEIDYDSRVYCLSVKNSILYVRKNGKPHWNGNTPACTIAQLEGRTITFFKEFTAVNMGAERFVPMVASQLRLLYPTHSDFKKNWKCWVDPSGFNRNDNDERKTALTVAASGFNPMPGPITWEGRRKSVADFLGGLDKGKPTFQIYEKGCPVSVKGFKGGYHYPEKNVDIAPDKLRPVKNASSHPHDTIQYTCSGVKNIMVQLEGNYIPSPSYSKEVNGQRNHR